MWELRQKKKPNSHNNVERYIEKCTNDNEGQFAILERQLKNKKKKPTTTTRALQVGGKSLSHN